MTDLASPADPLPHIRSAAEFASDFGVTPETIARLEVYAATLRHWQARINLVAPSTLDDAWHRHFADSAQIASLAPATASSWVDLGSGAGFPGLVCAILRAGRAAPRPRFTLVESDQRKCAFLREVVRQTSLATLIPVDILCARIEESATRAKLTSADVISARALAPLPRLLELAAPLLGNATTALFMKGRGAEDEVAEAQRSWQFEYDVLASRTEQQARIIRIHGSAVRAEG
ncbi:MAG: 16S rRNA (guanine(527)-N(7))-methyltransferase RsmG [Hyphomicrobiaceae bacterium]